MLDWNTVGDAGLKHLAGYGRQRTRLSVSMLHEEELGMSNSRSTPNSKDPKPLPGLWRLSAAVLAVSVAVFLLTLYAKQSPAAPRGARECATGSASALGLLEFYRVVN
jgi:hypothetical protein